MAESEVKSAALWLGKLLVEEMRYLDAVRDEVEELQTELDMLAAFVNEAVKNRHQDNVLRNLLFHARNIAYDCEDVIETYILKVARHGYEDYEGCQLGSVLRWACILRNAVPLHEIRSKIEQLRRRISGLQTRTTGYWVPLRIGAESNPDHHHPSEDLRFYPHDREEFVVGLDKDVAQLIKVLLDPSYSEKRVIAIHGMGGIGKSTLARELYDHHKIRRHFKGFAWTEVSRQFQADRVVEKLIYQLVPENDKERMERAEQNIKAGKAHEELYKLMKETKCLVVVDDIWTSKDWARLENAFPREKDATGSRILLTTRNEETLSGLTPSLVYRHPVQELDGESSWQLFEKTAFPSGKCTVPKMEKLGKDMLQHCGGVPLAIVVLGKTLKVKPGVEDWQQMHNNIISAQIQRGSTVSKSYQKVYDVLQVSYDELPSYLKHCFLHLANFPEDYEIPTDRLFQLWVGEGIVLKEDPNELEEDVAERYLIELVSRSMVQVGSKGPSGRIETCRLHDLMRDICIDIAKKEGFLQTINCEICTDLMASLPERDKRLRRLAIHVTKDQKQESLAPLTASVKSSSKVSRAPNLRSLLLFPVSEDLSEGNCDQPFVKTICKHFPLLRVLDCRNFPMGGKLPKKVGNLIHLRYLSLAGTRIAKLPSSIDQLLCLQTLDLQVDAHGVICIPNTLWKMKQLRHLYLPITLFSYNEGDKSAEVHDRYSIKGDGNLLLRGLQILQTIRNLVLDKVDLEGLSKLSSLRRLEEAFCMRNKAALYPFLQSSSMKSFSLRLNAQIMNEEPMILSSCKSMYALDIYATSGTCLTSLSLEMFPTRLVSLEINRYVMLDADPMPILGKLPNLARLVLRKCYIGEKMVCTAGGFPELIHLDFSELPSFRHWEVEEGALPKLKTLVLYYCPINMVPETLPETLPKTLPSSVKVSVYCGPRLEFTT